MASKSAWTLSLSHPPQGLKLLPDFQLRMSFAVNLGTLGAIQKIPVHTRRGGLSKGILERDPIAIALESFGVLGCKGQGTLSRSLSFSV